MISSPLPNLDALDNDALKALVVAQHSELLDHRSNAQGSAGAGQRDR